MFKKGILTFAFVAGVLFSPSAASPIFGADLTVPSFDLLTRGYWDSDKDSVVLQSRAEATLKLGGGYKFGGSLSFGIISEDLSYSGQKASDSVDSAGSETDKIDDIIAYLDNNTYLQFTGAHIVYRDLFGKEDTTLAWFIGDSQSLTNGEVFPLHFGTEPIATRYRGFRYFQSGYDGIHKVNGTGLSLSTGWGTDWNFSRFFLYQDGYLGEGIYSFDASAAFRFETIKMEAFLGGTFPGSDYGIYRAGFLFHYDPGMGGEFLAQVGVPRWEAVENFSIGDFFFLFEPRINLDPLKVILTLFWQPNFYLQQEQEEGESANIHINFLLGDSPDSRVSGGVETSFIINTNYADNPEVEQFEIKTSPYLTLASPGVSWNFGVDVQLLPFNLESMVQGVINIKAVF